MSTLPSSTRTKVFVCTGWKQWRIAGTATSSSWDAWKHRKYDSQNKCKTTRIFGLGGLWVNLRNIPCWKKCQVWYQILYPRNGGEGVVLNIPGSTNCFVSALWPVDIVFRIWTTAVNSSFSTTEVSSIKKYPIAPIQINVPHNYSPTVFQMCLILNVVQV